MSAFIRRLADVPAYHPANHTGTTNHRLISRDTVGATQLELLHGAIEAGEGATMHAHPGIEQACWILEGEAEVEIGGEVSRIGPGDCCFFPADTMHRLQVVGDRTLKVLVIYAPPYGENPANVVRG